ncbi:outer membrane protein assembly factor BamD [bacterium]|nr:outer membrane protein assembly factor BamD [bacterium]MCI0601942.1 outer membrane protein assembly factor BamD [bacterium]
MARKLIILMLFLGVVSCGPKQATLDPKTKSDAELYQLGLNYMKEEDWERAREAFRTVFESFPQSEYRITAKLGIADSFFGEGRHSSLLLAYQEYQDFISLFPFSPKACYAQLRMGHCYLKMAEKPDRDQTNTKKALEEFKKVVDNYPNCEQFQEARKYVVECYWHLAEHEYLVAFYYSRTGRPGAAIDRIKGLIKSYPETVHHPKHYLTLAQSLETLQQYKESCTYYDFILNKWPESEQVSKAREAQGRVCK